MTPPFVAHCNECFRVGWIGFTAEGEWKGHATTKRYCFDCCDRLNLNSNKDIYEPTDPLEERVRSAIEYHLSTAKVFTVTKVVESARTRIEHLYQYRPDLVKLIHEAIKKGFDSALEQALNHFVETRSVFSMKAVCNRAGISYVAVYNNHREWHKKILDASQKSKERYSKKRPPRKSIYQQYKEVTNPKPPAEVVRIVKPIESIGA